MIPIEDGFGEDMPVSKNGPLDFSNLYVRTHFPETWLWVDTETRYCKQNETNFTCQVCFFFVVLLVSVAFCTSAEKRCLKM